MSPRKKNTLLFIFLSFMAILPACARRLPSTSTPVTAAPTSTAQPVLTQVDRGTRSVVPQASPQPSDPSEVQALTPLPPPTERTDLIPTREPEPTETAKVIPSPIPTQVPASAWEGPGVIFIKDSNLMISSFNGTQMSMLSEEPVGPGPWGQDYSSQARRLVYESGNSLWVVDLGKNPHSILSVDRYLESPVISVDGTKIAYSLVTGFDEDQSKQLWTINPDGTENVLAIDNTSRYITDPGPFRLRPIAWSLDNTKVYLVTTTDSEATPVGMYVADLATGTIEKALTPQVTLWDISFSPDRTRIAYRTFQWKPVPGSMPEVGPPFTLSITDLATGATQIILESNTEQFFHPIWSLEGNRLAYSIRSGVVEGDLGLFTVELATGETTTVVLGSESSRMTPWNWRSTGILVYTEKQLSPGEAGEPLTNLYTITVAGKEQHQIDSAPRITVVGVIEGMK